MNYCQLSFLVIIIIFITIIISLIIRISIISSSTYLHNEKFESTDIFYGSEIRLRDFQDVLSITESQSINTNK
jgi:hypothetical protein